MPIAHPFAALLQKVGKHNYKTNEADNAVFRQHVQEVIVGVVKLLAGIGMLVTKTSVVINLAELAEADSEDLVVIKHLKRAFPQNYPFMSVHAFVCYASQP